MKKMMIIFLLIVSSFAVFEGGQIRAEDKKLELPIGRNYFDFRTIMNSLQDETVHNGTNDFKVKPNTTYTLVMSKAFLKERYSDIESYYFVAFDPDEQMPTEIDYIKDVANERVYVEFLNVGEYMNIEKIEMPVNTNLQNYEIILYEGTYADFFGYEPYLDDDDYLWQEGKILIDYDEQLSIETISSYLGATDPSGNGLDLTITKDTYSLSDKLPGTYEITYEVTFNQIRKAFYLMVQIEDLTNPIISIDQAIEISIVDKVNSDTILSYINVSDNVDEMTYNDLTITHDTYSAATTTGTYMMTVETTDSSGNKTELTFDIKLIDSIGPKIVGPSVIYLYATDSALTNEAILNKYLITDDVALNTSSIRFSLDEYQQNINQGIYQMTIEAKDDWNNTTSKDVFIHVIDNRGPEFNTNSEYIMEVTNKQFKTDLEIIAFVTTKLSSEGIDAKNVTINHNEYEMRATSKGQYYVYLDYEADDKVYQTRLLIDVKEENNNSFNPLYLLSGIPIVILAGYVIYRKRK